MIEGLVTVVLPIFKVERYLERCITSIVKQSYFDLEIILVDDGSPDNCPQICDEWVKKDPRIKVIHKKNEGLGMARNTGIENANGEYICFFDSDDYVDLELIEKTYSLAKKTDADIVTFGHGNVDKSGRIVNFVIPKTKKSLYEGEEVQERFLPDMIASDPKTGEVTNLHMSAWASFYSMDLIERARWKFVSEREIISEDIYSLLLLYHSVQKVVVLSEALYFHCDNETSLTNTYREDRYDKIRHFHKSCLVQHKKLGYNHEVAIRLHEPFVSFTIAAMKMIVVCDKTKKEQKKELKYIIDDLHFQNVLFEADICHMTFGRKVLFWAMKKKYYEICYILIHAKVKKK